MKEELQEVMSSSYTNVRDEQELERGQNYLKSYLIESNRPDVNSAVENAIEEPIEVNDTRDDGFYVVKTQIKDKTRIFYLDKLDDRFWSIHTTEKSAVSDKFTKKIVFPRFTGLDFPWLSNNFLEDITRKNEVKFNRFSLSYEDEFVVEDEEPDVGSLSMRLWGETAGNVLRTLKSNEELQNSTSLSSVGIRREFNGSVLLDDIKYEGKFTGRGDTVDGHLFQVNEVKDDYKDILTRIESEFALKYSSRDAGVSMDGSPITIKFSKKIEDVEKFAGILFSSKKPFRLWSVFNKISDNYYSCSAVDMHTGDKLDIEISENMMRIYLPKDCCGNVVMRLFTNIQQHYDSNCQIWGEQDQQLF